MKGTFQVNLGGAYVDREYADAFDAWGETWVFHRSERDEKQGWKCSSLRTGLALTPSYRVFASIREAKTAAEERLASLGADRVLQSVNSGVAARNALEGETR